MSRPGAVSAIVQGMYCIPVINQVFWNRLCIIVALPDPTKNHFHCTLTHTFTLAQMISREANTHSFSCHIAPEYSAARHLLFGLLLHPLWVFHLTLWLYIFSHTQELRGIALCSEGIAATHSSTEQDGCVHPLDTRYRERNINGSDKT